MGSSRMGGIEMIKHSQDDIILKHLQKFGSINAIEAIHKYGITRISARIYNLRKKGYAITSEESQSAEGFVDYVLNQEAQRLMDGKMLRDRLTAELALTEIKSDSDIQQMSQLLTNAAIEANQVVNNR